MTDESIDNSYINIRTRGGWIYDGVAAVICPWTRLHTSANFPNKYDTTVDVPFFIIQVYAFIYIWRRTPSSFIYHQIKMERSSNNSESYVLCCAVWANSLMLCMACGGILNYLELCRNLFEQNFTRNHFLRETIIIYHKCLALHLLQTNGVRYDRHLCSKNRHSLTHTQPWSRHRITSNIISQLRIHLVLSPNKTRVIPHSRAVLYYCTRRCRTNFHSLPFLVGNKTIYPNTHTHKHARFVLLFEILQS